MADYDLKSITADTDGPSADTELLFGSPDQSAGTPKPYSFAGIKTWIQSWLTKAMVGLGNVANSLQLVAANNLSDVQNVLTSRINLGVISTFKKFIAGRYYLPFGYGAGSAAAALAANRIFLVPWVAPQTMTISEFFVRIVTGNAGNWQAALYASDATTLMPTGTVLAKSNVSGATTTNATSPTTALTSNYQVTEGTLYWLCFNTDNATATFVCIPAGGSFYNAGSLIGSTTVTDIIGGSSVGLLGLSNNQTLGTWPDITGLSFSAAGGNGVPLVGFKVVSVP